MLCLVTKVVAKTFGHREEGQHVAHKPKPLPL